jgi:hypothetical protein
VSRSAIPKAKSCTRHLNVRICGPYVVSLVDEKPIFERYTAKVAVKNGDERDMCYDEIEQCA